MIYNGLMTFNKEELVKRTEALVKDAITIEKVRVGEQQLAPVTFFKKGVDSE
tara:strand:+ start:92 stop:247 length:156 start_codon:yes stop_codon:yes gene_type:complete